MSQSKSKYTLSGDILRKAMLWMSDGDNAKIFNGLKPEAMARVAKSSGLGKYLPTTKEGMALLVHVTRMVKLQPQMIPMIREVTCANGRVEIVAHSNVKSNDLSKHTKTVVPQSEMRRMSDLLKRGL